MSFRAAASKQWADPLCGARADRGSSFDDPRTAIAHLPTAPNGARSRHTVVSERPGEASELSARPITGWTDDCDPWDTRGRREGRGSSGSHSTPTTAAASEPARPVRASRKHERLGGCRPAAGATPVAPVCSRGAHQSSELTRVERRALSASFRHGTQEEKAGSRSGDNERADELDPAGHVVKTICGASRGTAGPSTTVS